LTIPFGNSGAFQLTKIESGVIKRALTADGDPGTEKIDTRHFYRNLIKNQTVQKKTTILFGVARDRYGFDTITASGESQYLHAVVGVLAQPVEDSFTSGDNLGIFTGFIYLFKKSLKQFISLFKHLFKQ
jgi:hypothetical protein